MSLKTLRNCAFLALVLFVSHWHVGLVAAQWNEDFGMGLPAKPEEVATANRAVTRPISPGPFEPSRDSIRQIYKVPRWFRDGKCGIFMHWGLYAVPAHHSAMEASECRAGFWQAYPLYS